MIERVDLDNFGTLRRMVPHARPDLADNAPAGITEGFRGHVPEPAACSKDKDT
jgi:hypothetical protein